MRRLRSLARNTRGATIVEFAIVAPVMMILLMGISDLAYQVYAQSILNGALQKAARDSSIQGGAENTAAIDAKVTAMVKNIAANATIVFSRKNYDTFSVIKPEPFVDTNGNGVRNTGECYTDVNGNGTWDADPGLNGQGGANDVTMYTATVTYPRMFPVAGLFGWPSTQTIAGSTLLKNQPYASQTTVTPATVCT
ncbi:TadE/TadG family type IV pilus assembly protein [Sphingomonas sp.]|uniref:TadE/TadG family type IV pilus assembly protein n=1 Tax=Sphingomonas sp. TaxID=28214 RepID=UPI002E319B45|nr:TadE/TadG family type IV pilus assembly protein [Sphingomonas sp.]HEX4693506.1 TadE/TadG family type IV pilus assembly protein [Sphingomonas sp.]